MEKKMKKIQKIGIFAVLSMALPAILIISCPQTEEDEKEVLKEWEDQGPALQTVTVDFGTDLGVPDYKATGFLYGLSPDGTLPKDPLLSDLKPKLFRGGAIYYVGMADGAGWVEKGTTQGQREAGYVKRFSSIKAQYDRVMQYGPDVYYYALLSDLWFSGKFRNDTEDSGYPGDNGDWSQWEDFLRRVAADKIENSMDNMRYDIWNEPESGYFWPGSRGLERYFQMWKMAVEVLRSADPDAVIVGPSYGGFNQTQLSTWLNRTKADNVLPDILDWHFSLDPVSDVETAKRLLREKNITTIKAITIGEYLLDNDYRREQYSGHTAWYISRLQKADITGAIHAVWRNVEDGSLNDILTAGLQPKGQWWVYKSYADITGTLLEVTASRNIDGVAGINSEKTARIILGNNFYRRGVEGDAIGNIGVSLAGLTALYPNGKIKVEVSEIPETIAPLLKPILKQKFYIKIVNDAANFTIPWATWNEAYTITITPY
jgi:hypothetical protein